MRRDWTVAVFVVHAGRVLLLWHRKHRMWLPPGGHIEAGELPDDAARREVLEETGLEVELVGPRGLPEVQVPRQLVVPAGIQVEPIGPGHEHVDLVYLARPLRPGPLEANHESERLGWYAPEDLASLPLTEEIRLWCRRALERLGARKGREDA
ncbi:NUDIX hydrolase [Limnochorda pilosa]|uniref:NUDIX hydrolase n=1 Tax=Limnochorda pilosa TaxID=1555112 RepID=A0A0K2SPT7_LIMPI|nr:NUDIX domain-containing protein [Limnochorda pilosa]BAS29111.1 NUDIX hydrolase [Limnochorda pilosa]